MGIVSTIAGFFGFGVGITIGLVVGYFFFIFFQPTDVENPVIRPLVEQDSETLQSLLQEIPIWVKNPDHDRIDWPYLNKAICKQVKTIVDPIIAEQIPQYKIDSVQFEVLSLGCLPPAFTGMKFYNTDEKELIMEPTLKWAGNPNILVAIKAFRMKATIQLQKQETEARIQAEREACRIKMELKMEALKQELLSQLQSKTVLVQRVCQGSTVPNKQVSDLQTTSQEATGDKS